MQCADILYSRLDAFSDVSRPENNIYSLSRIPTARNMVWGRGRVDDTLVNPMTNIAISVWIVAELNDMSFKNRDGPTGTAVVWATPVMRGEVEIAAELLCSNRYPTQRMCFIMVPLMQTDLENRI